MTSNHWWLQMLRCAHTLISRSSRASKQPSCGMCLVLRHALAKRHTDPQLKSVTPFLLDACTCIEFDQWVHMHTDSAAEHHAMRVLSKPRRHRQTLTGCERSAGQRACQRVQNIRARRRGGGGGAWAAHLRPQRGRGRQQNAGALGMQTLPALHVQIALWRVGCPMSARSAAL